jgi:hypothetical protein
MQEIENEIDVLESTLGYLEMAMREVSDSHYHTYIPVMRISISG